MNNEAKGLALHFSYDIHQLWRHPELETMAFMAISSAVYRFTGSHKQSETVIPCQTLIGFIQDTYCDFPAAALMQTLTEYVKYTQARGLDIARVSQEDTGEDVLKIKPCDSVSILPSSLEASAIWAAGEIALRLFGSEAGSSSLGKLFSDFAVLWEMEALEPLHVSIENRATPESLWEKWDRGFNNQQKKKSHP